MMAEEATSQDAIVPAPVETRPEVTESMETSEKIEPAVENSTSADPVEPKDPVAPAPAMQDNAPVEPAPAESEPLPLVEKTQDTENTNDRQSKPEQLPEDKLATTQENVEMKQDIKEDDATPAAEPADDAAVSAEASSNKSKFARRKSGGGVPEHKKKLNKKASKAKMTHTNAQPGDYFMIRLKGYPLWPGIVCDETMLPNTLLKHRPVTAARPDGTYREDYADGGPKINDRTFPVMYLHTNEFSWIPNTDLVDMDLETVGNVTSSMRKDLAAAHILAAEQHDLDFYKEILKSFMEARAAELEAKEAAKAAKKAEKAEKAEKASKSKRKSKAPVDDEDADGDIEMADAPGEEVDDEDVEAATSEKKNKKKRKASDDGEDSPKTDSVKKPKTTINLKLTSTPKANGTSTPKSAKDSAAKAPKQPKPRKEKASSKAKDTPEVVAPPKEPELTPEEKRIKKEKEILFLRHKLQKGLLTKDQVPKEEEMKQMSEFVGKLEGYADLEVSIIRATKINKVLKAILKIPTIPKEEEFQFKPRSQSLLDKWNKLLASEQGTPVVGAPSTTTNGVKEDAKPDVEDAKATPGTTTNGTKESSTDEKAEEKAPVVEDPVAEPKEDAPKAEDAPAPSVTESAQEETKPEVAPVESAA